MSILPAAGSAVAMGSSEFIAPGIPKLMSRSSDWQVRFDPSPVYVKPNQVGLLERAARERATYTDITFILAEGLGLDVFHARSLVEEPYAPRVAALTPEEMAVGGFFAAELLFAKERRLLPGRGNLPPAVAVQSDVAFYPPRE